MKKVKKVISKKSTTSKKLTSGQISRVSTPNSKLITHNFNWFLTHRTLIKLELVILALLALVFAFQYSLAHFPGFKYAVEMATTKKPETFTELYFENHINLPKQVIRWQEYPFTFTIHNLEYKDMDYPYTVYLERDGVKTTLSTGSASLKHDEYRTISEFAGPFKQLRTKVVVELSANRQSIAFWLEK